MIVYLLSYSIEMRTDCSSLSYLWIILFVFFKYHHSLLHHSVFYLILLVFNWISVYCIDSISISILWWFYCDSLIVIQVYLMYYTWLISFYPLILNLSIKKHQLSYYVSNSLYLVITLLKYSLFILLLVSTFVSLLFLSLTLILLYK